MTEGVETRTVELRPPTGRWRSSRPGPPSPARRAVIVVQEAFGVNHYIERVTERFAGAGFDAVAPAFFHRAGGGTASYDDFSKVHAALRRPDRRRHPDRPRRRVRPPRVARPRAGGDRCRRLLLRRSGHVPRRGPSRPSARRSGSTAAGIVTGALPAVPAARRREPRRCRRRGSGSSATRTAGSRSRTSRRCAPRCARRAGPDRDRPLPGRGARLLLRRAARRTTQRRPPTRGRARSTGSTATWPAARRDAIRRTPTTATSARPRASRPGTTRTTSAGSPSARSARCRWSCGATTASSRRPSTSSTCTSSSRWSSASTSSSSTTSTTTCATSRTTTTRTPDPRAASSATA